MTKRDRKRVQILGDEGDKSVYIDLDCGRRIEFGVSSIAEDSREWLAQIIQNQVNEIVARERHDAVETFKYAFNEIMAPKSFAQVANNVDSRDILEYIEHNVATKHEGGFSGGKWMIGNLEIAGHNFRDALKSAMKKK